jgi:hypothetical protein
MNTHPLSLKQSLTITSQLSIHTEKEREATMWNLWRHSNASIPHRISGIIWKNEFFKSAFNSWHKLDEWRENWCQCLADPHVYWLRLLSSYISRNGVVDMRDETIKTAGGSVMPPVPLFLFIYFMLVNTLYSPSVIPVEISKEGLLTYMQTTLLLFRHQHSSTNVSGFN